MTEILTLKDARTAGVKRYFTGQPCKHGHVAERLVSTRKCCACNVMHVDGWRAANPEKVREYDTRWRENNPEKAKSAVLKWHGENRARILGISRRWYANNPHARTAKEAKRRASKRLRVPAWFGELDVFVMREAARLAQLRKKITGVEWHVDHMIPLAARCASGLHCAANLQVIPATVNTKKLNRLVLTTPGEWLRNG